MNNSDLHGSAPDDSPLALLIIDMINDLEYEGGEQLLGHALPVARRIAALKARAQAAGVPVIYANDNFGRWRSDFREVVNHCLHDGVRGRPLAELLVPHPDDYFVLKPKHSAFFGTTLDTLLKYLGARALILTGVAGDNCVLFTANDAYMRDLALYIPADCVASISAEENARALAYMQRVAKADIRPSSELDLVKLRRANCS
ncbi:MAG TPA: isochorismatase family cysteine hydrolase [Caldilineaceae bacterium]|nr:isochorismatase family cysteine hydrolase [Caldilineaceae bacterium]